MNQQIEPRPEVLAFARLMEQRLRDKDAEKGSSWKEKNTIDLVVNICAASRRIEMDLHPLKNDEITLKALVDMANHCMMLADVMGAPGRPCECRITNLDGQCVECGKAVE